MPADPSGTPNLSLAEAMIGNKRWFVLENPGQAQEAGGRAWTTDKEPYQGNPEPFAIPLTDFSQGYGFSYEGIAGTYDRATGLDLSAPGKPGTWPIRASGASFVSSADDRGWMFQCGGYLYVARGRLVCKYAINDVAGGTWAIIERHDLGSGNVIAGRPMAGFRSSGKAYVPIRAFGSSLQRFHELTTVATTTVEVQTITISGTPTSGTYTVTFDGKTTAAIAYNADGPTLQAALRLIAGLEDITVSTSGSSPNYTHTITLTGVAGAMGTASPPQFTSTDSTSGGTHAIAHATTSAGVSDTWTQGPANCTFRNFRKWKQLLTATKNNEVFTVSGDPMTGSNWAPDVAGTGNVVGDASRELTDAVALDTQLITFPRPDGLFSLNESLQASNRLPDLEAIVDDNNGVGSEAWAGQILMPHKSGLVVWSPGSYALTGAEQDNALDANLSEGWGRVQGIAVHGKYAFLAANDNLRGVGSIMSLQPPSGSRARGPYLPHQHYEKSGVTFEALAVIQSSFEPATPKIPATWSDDNAVGSNAWSNPTNAAADDDTFASVSSTGTTHYLKGLAVGEALPASATILGIKASVKRKALPSATPSFRSEAHATTGASPAASITISKPSGTADGDFLFAAIEFAGTSISSDFFPPAGWTLLTSGTGVDRIFAFYYKIASSEPSSWTWVVSPLANATGVVCAYSGVDSANPFAVAGTSFAIQASFTGGHTADMVGWTTTEDHVRVIQAVIPGYNSTIASVPSAMTSRANVSSTSLTPYDSITVADVDVSTAGTTGVQTWTGAAGMAAGAKLDGIMLGLRGAATVVDATVKLVKGGSVVGNNKADTSTHWPSAVGTVDYGGSADLWGTTWSASDINGATFGVVLSATVTSGVAYVDTISLTVYYSLPGTTDPPSYLVAMEVASDRLTVTPRVWQLPRAGLTVANDPNVSRAISTGATLRTSRYYRPSRGLQKTYDCVELYLEASPQTNTPGLQVWASIDEGTAFQLLDETGAAATLRTTGFHQVYFPATSAVGHYCQIQFVIPAVSGVQVPMEATWRDAVVRGHYRPLLTDLVKDIVIVLDKGEFKDKGGEQRTVAQMVADLSGLAGPNDEPVPYRSPIETQRRSETIGYCTVLPPRFKEVTFKGHDASTLVALLSLRRMVMPRA